MNEFWVLLVGLVPRAGKLGEVFEEIELSNVGRRESRHNESQAVTLQPAA